MNLSVIYDGDKINGGKICGKMFKQKQDIGIVSKYLPPIHNNYKGKISKFIVKNLSRHHPGEVVKENTGKRHQ